MKKKSLQLFATLALLGAAGVTQPASAEVYSIPATQDEFNSQWEVIAGSDGKTWAWTDSPKASAWTNPNNSSNTDPVNSPILICKSTIQMKAGEVYYFYANVASQDYDDESRFYIMLGTDKNNLQPIKQDQTAFYVYNPSSASEPSFIYKPTESNKDKCKVTVEQDGTYYFGIRSWYSSGRFTQADKKLYVADIKIEKDTNYPQKVQNPKATAVAGGALEATLTWTWPTKNKDNSDISGNLGARIYRFTSSTKDQLYKAENVIATVTGGVAGQPGTFTDNATNSSTAVPSAGKYYYYIAPFNDEGENSEVSSSTVAECKWIGEDNRVLNPLNAVAKADGDNVVVTWKARKSGEWGYNGGWIDESQLKFKITRSKDGADAVVLTDDYVTTAGADLMMTYQDNNLDGAGSYVYNVSALYKEAESNVQKTTAIFAGGALEVPYIDDFSSADKFNLYTIVSTNSSFKWIRNYSGYVQFMASTYSSSDASLITPPIKLVAGKTYKISCKSWVEEVEDDDDYGYGYGSSEPDPKDLKFTAGTEPTLAGMPVLATVNIDKGESEKMQPEAYFSPTADGSYYFGVRCNNTNGNKIYVDDIEIVESVSVPATVADLSVVPDATGANKAKVTFTLPDKTNGGAELTTLTKVVVSRTDTEAETPAPVVVKTLTGDKATPGTAVSFDDNVDAPGMFSYSVVSTLNDKDSEAAASVPLWVGYDVPKAVSSLSVRADLLDKDKAEVKFTPLTGENISFHGGYIDKSNLKYKIYRRADSEEQYVLLTTTATSPYNDNTIANAPWDTYKYAISVVNGEMESAKTETNGVTYGKIPDFPYNPDLTDSFVNALQGRGFTGNNGIAFTSGVIASTERIAYLPPFHVETGSGLKFNLTLSLSRYNEAFEELLEVYLCEIERETPELRNNRIERDGVVIPGEGAENRTSLKVIPVHATSEAPATEVVNFDVPAAGRYRIALRLASVENKGLTIHSIKFADGVNTGVTEIGADSIFSGDVVSVSVYALDGTLLASCESGADLNLSALRPGVYILRALTADGKTLTAKIRR